MKYSIHQKKSRTHKTRPSINIELGAPNRIQCYLFVQSVANDTLNLKWILSDDLERSKALYSSR